MKEIPISQFKATCLAVVEEVRRTGKPVRLTKFGHPIAEVVRVSDKKTPPWVGSMQGTIKVLGDIVSPAVDETEWDALR